MSDRKNSGSSKHSKSISDNKRGGYTGPTQSKPPATYQKPKPTPPKPSKPTEATKE